MFYDPALGNPWVAEVTNAHSAQYAV